MSNELRILFEDKDLLAIDKPAGLSTESGKAMHPSAERLAQELLRDARAGDALRRLGLEPYLRAVHRLDRASSGLLLLAKNKPALSNLMTQFERRTVEKVYLAEVLGMPAEEQGVLRHFLKKTDDGRSAQVFDHPETGSQAVELGYRILEKTASGARMEIFPKTGRFHQIRAQLAYSGFPIIGDTRYGGPVWQEHSIKLHARSLRVRHPKTGAELLLEAPAPENW